MFGRRECRAKVPGPTRPPKRDFARKIREAKLAFEKEDLLEQSVVQRGLHSSIFNIKGNEALSQLLNQNNIICSRRGEGIRISFHYFNTLKDLDKLMEVLRKSRR